MDSYLDTARVKLGVRTRREAAERLVSRYGPIIPRGTLPGDLPPGDPTVVSSAAKVWHRADDHERPYDSELAGPHTSGSVQARRRIKEFTAAFPPLRIDPLDLLPSFSWTQIERQLRSLAGPDFERVPWELEILRAAARLNPPEMFLRDLLILAWSLIEESGSFSIGEVVAMS